MPGPNAKSYIANTLAICIFTTIVCGGVTEKILTRYGMKQPEENDGELHGSSNAYENLVPTASQAGDRFGRSSSSMTRRINAQAHGLFKQLDTRYLKPLFGGKGEESRRGAYPIQTVQIASPEREEDSEDEQEMAEHYRGEEGDGGGGDAGGGAFGENEERRRGSGPRIDLDFEGDLGSGGDDPFEREDPSVFGM